MTVTIKQQLRKRANAPGLTTSVDTDMLCEYISQHVENVNNGYMQRQTAYNADNQWSEAGRLCYRVDQDGKIFPCEIELFNYIPSKKGREQGNIKTGTTFCVAVVTDIHTGPSTTADIIGYQIFNETVTNVVSALDNKIVNWDTPPNERDANNVITCVSNIYITDELNLNMLLTRLSMDQKEEQT